MNIEFTTKVMFNISFIDKCGERILLGPNQGRFFSASPAEKEAWLKACFKNSGEDKLVDICGEQSRGTFRVDAFDCYDHGDAVSRYPRSRLFMTYFYPSMFRHSAREESGHGSQTCISITVERIVIPVTLSWILASQLSRI